jgi:hypothetical protein
MLGSFLGNLYRKAISRLLGLDTLFEQRLPLLVRQEVDAALLAFARGESGGRGLTLDVDQTARFFGVSQFGRIFPAAHAHGAQCDFG